MDQYICKIATIEEINKKWDYQISRESINIQNQIILKKNNIERHKKRHIIQYYGLLNSKIICECTAALNSSVVQNAENLVDEKTAYLTAFRTIDEYQGKGYFSKLFKFMINDLKNRGYDKVTLGVEPTEIKNKQIYHSFGFDEHIKDGIEVYGDGTTIAVEYYGKSIK